MSDASVYNIIIAGVGGQGVLLLSNLVAHAAIEAGFDVKTNEVHGMAQRGGSVLAQVRFGSKVYSPLVWEGSVDLLISLEAGEALRYAHYLKKDAAAIVSSQKLIPVSVSSGKAVYPDDMEERLRKTFPRLFYLDTMATAHALGNIKTANMISLGAASTLLPQLESQWHLVMNQLIPEKYQEINRQAFEKGKRSIS